MRKCKPKKCKACNGKGKSSSGMICSPCNGTGVRSAKDKDRRWK